MMMKRTVMLFSAVLVLLLAACGSNVDEQTEKKVTKQAKEVVTLLNEEKYEELIKKSDSKMKKELTLESFREVISNLKESGTFEKFEKSSVEEKENIYVTVLVAKYSKDKRVFTISFNKQDEVAGLFYK